VASNRLATLRIGKREGRNWPGKILREHPAMIYDI
jgi:hypothetical protein